MFFWNLKKNVKYVFSNTGCRVQNIHGLISQSLSSLYVLSWCVRMHILCVVRGFVPSHGCSLSVRPPAVIAVSQSAAVSAQHNAVQQQSRRHQRRFDEAETAWWTLQTLHVQLKLSQQLPHADLCLHYFWRTAVIDYGRLSLYIAASDPYGNVACNLFTVYCCTRVAGNVLIVYLLLCHDRPNKFLSFSCCISL